MIIPNTTQNDTNDYKGDASDATSLITPDSQYDVRQLRDEILRDNRFTPYNVLYGKLKQFDNEADVKAIIDENPPKIGLVAKADTHEFLSGKAKLLRKTYSGTELVRRLVDLMGHHCEDTLSPEEIRSIAAGNNTSATKTFAPVRLTRTLLGDGMKNGLPEPEELEPDLLLKGGAHQIFTGPEEGKSWLALWLTKNAIKREEPVAFLDMENGKRLITERLGLLGVESDEADKYLHYYHVPALDMSRDALGDYQSFLDEVKPDLIIFDSWIGFLAACGLDENSPTHVEQWSNAYVHPAKLRGCTVVVLDHVPHDAERSRGATRKKDMVDVQWHLKKRGSFDRDTVGYIQLTKKKDRESWLPEKVGFSVGGGEDGFVFHRSEGTYDDGDGDGLTESAKAALNALDADLGYCEWRNKIP